MKPALKLTTKNWMDEITESDLPKDIKRMLRSIIYSYFCRCPFPGYNLRALTIFKRLVPTILIDNEEMTFSVKGDSRECFMNFEQAKEWKNGFPPLIYKDDKLLVCSVKLKSGEIMTCTINIEAPGQFSWFSLLFKCNIPNKDIVGWKK